jgi:hypothetical protein
MRLNAENKRMAIRLTLLIIILFSLISGSCSSRKNKLNRTGLIPEKDLVSILTDVYLADGLLSLPKIHNLFSDPDTLSSYLSIIEKHGYTKETMDKTMKYYFIKNPKRLIQIYDQTLGILSEMESRVEKESRLLEGHYNNLWPGKEYYCFPFIRGSDSTRFDLALYNPGVYSLNFSVTLFPDDQSVNSRLAAYLCHPDSIDTGKRQYLKTMKYIKDGRPHKYTITYRLPEKTTFHLRGLLFDFENNPELPEKHAIFENISLTYTYEVV